MRCTGCDGWAVSGGAEHDVVDKLRAEKSGSRGAILSLAFAHCCSDLAQSSVAALLPFLVVLRGYSLSAVGAFVLAASIGGSVLQPVFGAHGDRTGARWLMPVGLIVGGSGVGLLGFIDSYPLALVAVACGSMGVAAFHPEGARWARSAAGSNVASGMGVFSVGGSVGFALGPPLVAAVVVPFGLRGTLLLELIPLAAAAVVLVSTRHLRPPELQVQEAELTAADRLARRDEWGPFSRLVVLYGIQSAVLTGLFAFVPLLLVSLRGVSPGASNVTSTVLLAAAALGTLLGGRAADRYGRRVVLVLPMVVLAPAIALVPHLGYVALMPLMVLIGLAVDANLSTAIVMAQEYLASRIGLAAGVLVGASVGFGGLAGLLLGMLGDAAGTTAVIYTVAVLPLLAAALAFTLPRPLACPVNAAWSLRAATGR